MGTCRETGRDPKPDGPDAKKDAGNRARGLFGFSLVPDPSLRLGTVFVHFSSARVTPFGRVPRRNVRSSKGHALARHTKVVKGLIEGDRNARPDEFLKCKSAMWANDRQ
jgi:hypothetical protein